MGKKFRDWDVDQMWLLPPSVKELVPEGHPAHFVRELVRRELNLREILAVYREERGYPPYHPVMMTALLLYTYTQGIYSSRRIARACQERVDYMAVTAQQTPDFRTINEFRSRHLKALDGLFGQVLTMCNRAGLVKLGHVSLDGTKVQANASKHKAMSYERMCSEEKRLREVVRGWFAEAERIDAEEDKLYGKDKRGDEMPSWVSDAKERSRRLKEAREALEREAREEAEKLAEKEPDEIGSREREVRRTGKPPQKAQRNFTDPDSRILPIKGGVVQGYNAQVAVDGAHQIIIAQRVQTSPVDVRGLKPLLSAASAVLRRNPKELSADAGFCTNPNLAHLVRRRIKAFVAPGRARHGDNNPSGKRRWRRGSRIAAMALKLKRAGRRSRYRLRKQIVEPVFGQIKYARGFRQFLLRGLEKVRGEWAIICTAHNLLKLANATT
jgi:transposase